MRHSIRPGIEYEYPCAEGAAPEGQGRCFRLASGNGISLDAWECEKGTFCFSSDNGLLQVAYYEASKSVTRRVRHEEKKIGYGWTLRECSFDFLQRIGEAELTPNPQGGYTATVKESLSAHGADLDYTTFFILDSALQKLEIQHFSEFDRND